MSGDYSKLLRRPRKPDPPKEPGRCAHCGCTEATPCKFGRYARCTWLIVEPTGRRVCSKRECVQAEIDRLFSDLERVRRKAERQIA